MFIYSVRAGTLKFVGIICVALVALITLIAFVPSVDGGINVSAAVSDEKSIRYDKIKSADDVAEFLSQFGWEVKKDGCEVVEVTIPAEFDRVFASYNELQKQQGLDLTRYRRKSATRYTMEITNYGDYNGRVLANVLVYHNRVIGGDVCSADMTGFMHGFEVN